MPSCLGIYIEEHLIKYAKVSKEHENIKVEAFGIKFYDKIGDAISQVIEETYSQKTPISVNMSEEMYNYFDMFALLTKTDLQKAIKTEFESYCSDKGYNPNVFERRYAVVDNQLDKEKIKVIHIADNKIELNKRIQEIDGYKLTNISPISMSIPNLINIEPNENCIIVNMEDKTTITTIIDSKIYHVDVLDEGSTDILSKINLKENSYSKSYEICKNTTIYTSEGKELTEEETGYLEDIMPTLYDILGQIRKIINDSMDKIEKVYSHPQGLMQCKGFLDEHPDWDQVKVANTAISAKKVADDNKPVKAAICSERAAKMYGLEILKREVNDEGNNTTRFVIMSKKKQYRKDAGKVSISFSVPHESGSLYNILTHFMFNNVSMSNIESRPLPGRKWEYGFYVDVIGNLDDPAIRNSLAGIKEETKDFKILGNF